MGRGMMAGKKPKANKQAQMQQLQAMQDRMMALQEEIDKTEVEASAGGGAVKVKVNGQHQLVSINIDKDVLDDVEMLQDLVLTATNEAMRQIDEMSQNEMGKLTGGLNLPF